MLDKLSSGCPRIYRGFLFVTNKIKYMAEQNAGNNQLITVDAAKTLMSVGLTKANLLVQTIASRASSLVINEDPENLEAVSKLLADVRAAKKSVEETHKEVKKPYFDAGKAVDTAKNDMIAAIDSAIGDVGDRYNKVMAEIERRKQEAEAKKQKDAQIKAGIEANILDFSTKIAACKTRKDLTDVERLINLEKSPGRATKYGEWHEFAIERYNTALLPVIKDQKEKVDEYERLEEERKAAEAENDPVKMEEIAAKMEEKGNEIIQNQVKVQEAALNSVVPSSTAVEEILPDITKAGSTIICEIIDEKTVYKKHRELLSVELKLSDAKKLATTLRDAGAFKGQDVLEFDGMRFTIEKRYK
jgi:hypothetical protein